MSDTSHLERLACELEASLDQRVLRRSASARGACSAARGTRTGVILDVETTGLDHEHDAVIELAMMRFAYDQDDAVLGVVDTFQSFSDPGRPIEPEITAITGINDNMVRGCALDPEAVRSFMASCRFRRRRWSVRRRLTARERYSERARARSPTSSAWSGTCRRITCFARSTASSTWKACASTSPGSTARSAVPSIDPELLIRMLLVGYCLGIRSERRL